MNMGFYRLFVSQTHLEGDGVPASFPMISQVGASLMPGASFLPVAVIQAMLP